MDLLSIISLIYFLFFSILAYKKFAWTIFILLATLPSYLIRLNFGPLPSTILELQFAAIFLIWLLKYSRQDWPEIKQTILDNKWFFIFLAVFFIASGAGVLRSDMIFKSLGQWRAYFLEPLLFFFILIGRKKYLGRNFIIWPLIVSALGVSLLAIMQKLTGGLLPPSLWDDILNGRVVSFFTSPNSIGLYTVPIIFLWPLVAGNKIIKFILPAVLVIALLFSRSEGALLALLSGIILFIYLLNYKKTALAFAVGGILIASIYNPIRTAVLFQNQSGQNRLTLWSHTYEYLTASPDNFFLGAGIRQYFRKVEKQEYDPEKMERLIYPHNIFLNFWTEIGLFGLIAFIAIYTRLIIFSVRLYKQSDKLRGAVFLSLLLAFLVHGLVDVPYFKNDLAIIFWTLAALIILPKNFQKSKTNTDEDGKNYF